MDYSKLKVQLESSLSESTLAGGEEDSRLAAFFKTSPLFIGQTKFTPLAGVKNILITGGAGFIASYVVRHFVHQYPEYNIISYDKLDYCASTNNHLALENCANFSFEKGDITGTFPLILLPLGSDY
jgi:hypothetical protein